METNTDKRKTLIRRLLVEQLLPEEKQNLLKRNSVENEMKNAGIMYQIINNIKISVPSFHIMEYYPHCENRYLVSSEKLLFQFQVSFDKPIHQ